jgi:hypothetical protein
MDAKALRLLQQRQSTAAGQCYCCQHACSSSSSHNENIQNASGAVSSSNGRVCDDNDNSDDLDVALQRGVAACDSRRPFVDDQRRRSAELDLQVTPFPLRQQELRTPASRRKSSEATTSDRRTATFWKPCAEWTHADVATGTEPVECGDLLTFGADRIDFMVTPSCTRASNDCNDTGRRPVVATAMQRLFSDTPRCGVGRSTAGARPAKDGISSTLSQCNLINGQFDEYDCSSSTLSPPRVER